MSTNHFFQSKAIYPGTTKMVFYSRIFCKFCISYLNVIGGKLQNSGRDGMVSSKICSHLQRSGVGSLAKFWVLVKSTSTIHVHVHSWHKNFYCMTLYICDQWTVGIWKNLLHNIQKIPSKDLSIDPSLVDSYCFRVP